MVGSVHIFRYNLLTGFGLFTVVVRQVAAVCAAAARLLLAVGFVCLQNFS